MWFNQQTFSVYRPTASTGNWGKEWAKVGTIIGTFAPVSGSDGIRNDQDFSDVRNLISCKLRYVDSVQEQDEIVDADGNQYHVRLIQVYRNVLPHVEIFLGKSQWRRT
jgi:hypothetical protein